MKFGVRGIVREVYVSLTFVILYVLILKAQLTLLSFLSHLYHLSTHPTTNTNTNSNIPSTTYFPTYMFNKCSTMWINIKAVEFWVIIYPRFYWGIISG